MTLVDRREKYLKFLIFLKITLNMREKSFYLNEINIFRSIFVRIEHQQNESQMKRKPWNFERKYLDS